MQNKRFPWLSPTRNSISSAPRNQALQCSYLISRAEIQFPTVISFAIDPASRLRRWNHYRWVDWQDTFELKYETRDLIPNLKISKPTQGLSHEPSCETFFFFPFPSQEGSTARLVTRHTRSKAGTYLGIKYKTWRPWVQSITLLERIKLQNIG